MVFKLRREHVRALDATMLGSFELRATAHLRRCFPEVVGKASDDQMLELVRFGIERARSHGIDLECDVLRYLDLMCVFGVDFDRDPACPWAAQVLGDPQTAGSTLRTNTLMAAAKSSLVEPTPAGTRGRG
ncbi:MAG TPA: hypothetical protein PLS53_13970 [Thermoanaerobaculaceae bacterium]|nr:hypothetical protein [Thermoanaerobaculaceae bacterium]